MPTACAATTTHALRTPPTRRSPPSLHLAPRANPGTPLYCSPEIIAQQPYTFAADVWALGCTLYEAAARRTAFEARGLPQLVVKIMRNACVPFGRACGRFGRGLRCGRLLGGARTQGACGWRTHRSSPLARLPPRPSAPAATRRCRRTSRGRCRAWCP